MGCKYTVDSWSALKMGETFHCNFQTPVTFKRVKVIKMLNRRYHHHTVFLVCFFQTRCSNSIQALINIQVVAEAGNLSAQWIQSCNMTGLELNETIQLAVLPDTPVAVKLVQPVLVTHAKFERSHWHSHWEKGNKVFVKAVQWMFITQTCIILHASKKKLRKELDHR